MIDLVFAIGVAAALGGIASILAELLMVRLRKKRGEETLEQRITRLTSSLHDATPLINHIQAEIEARQQLVDKLQRDVDTYNKIVESKKPEVEAVAQLLRGELKKEGRRSFWQGVAINFVFFVLGAVLSAVIALIVT